MNPVPTHPLTLAQVQADLASQGYSWGRVNPTEYHAWKKQLPGLVVSYSSLKEFAECPFAYKYNLENGIKKDSEALRLGSRVDTLALTPDLFETKYRLGVKKVQLKKDGDPYADGRQDKDQKAEWERLYQEEGIEHLDAEEMDKVHDIAYSLLTLMDAENIILGENCTSQLAMFIRLTEIAGIKLDMPVTLCACLDIAPMDGRPILYDAKTTSHSVRSARSLTYVISDLHYALQGAVYTACWNVCAKQEAEFAFLFVETSAQPYMARMVTLDETELNKAKSDLAAYLVKLAAAEHSQNYGTPVLPTISYQSYS